MAGCAFLACDGGGGMVYKPAHKGRCIVAIAAVGSGRGRYVINNLACSTQPVVAGFTRDGVRRQYCVIEHTRHLVTGRIVAEIARERDIAC